MATCSIDGCVKPGLCRGWCDMHYHRWKRNGDPSTLLQQPRAGRVCSVDGCVKPVDARGWCTMHWKRWRKHGDPRSGQPQRIMGDDLARLMSHVRVDPSGCWIWSGSLNGRGYGQMYWRGRVRRAHRVSYALLKGPLVEGLDLDHLCRVTLCVNPAHLEQVTHLVNVRRGWRARGLSPSGLGVIGSIL